MDLVIAFDFKGDNGQSHSGKAYNTLSVPLAAAHVSENDLSDTCALLEQFLSRLSADPAMGHLFYPHPHTSQGGRHNEDRCTVEARFFEYRHYRSEIVKQGIAPATSAPNKFQP